MEIDDAAMEREEEGQVVGRDHVPSTRLNGGAEELREARRVRMPRTRSPNGGMRGGVERSSSHRTCHLRRPSSWDVDAGGRPPRDVGLRDVSGVAAGGDCGVGVGVGLDVGDGDDDGGVDGIEHREHEQSHVLSTRPRRRSRSPRISFSEQ